MDAKSSKALFTAYLEDWPRTAEDDHSSVAAGSGRLGATQAIPFLSLTPPAGFGIESKIRARSLAHLCIFLFFETQSHEGTLAMKAAALVAFFVSSKGGS